MASGITYAEDLDLMVAFGRAVLDARDGTVRDALDAVGEDELRLALARQRWREVGGPVATVRKMHFSRPAVYGRRFRPPLVSGRRRVAPETVVQQPLDQAIASAPAGRIIGQSGSVAARKTASATSCAVVTSPLAACCCIAAIVC